MGKASRWLRSFLTGGKKDRKCSDNKAATQSSSSTAPTPSSKEKRRWSFRRPPAAPTPSHCFSDVVHDYATPAPEKIAGDEVAVEVAAAAAIRIQSAFRSYLARKALCALRGMVKLQAMVRGQLVRRQADATLRRMQALVAAQRRARAERLRLLDDGHVATSPRPPTANTGRRCSSPQQHHRRSRNRKPPLVEEENVKVVEVDDNGGGAARASAAAVAAKVSPTPSAAVTEASGRTASGRFEGEYAFSVSGGAASSEASGRRHHHRGGGGEQVFVRNYMSNTESSRAKARSQSAPRQRHEHHQASGGGGGASASPSPSCGVGGEWTMASCGGGERRRRASLDPRDLVTGGVGGARMERCGSQARASASAACPWAVRLDRSTASLAGGSDCG